MNKHDRSHFKTEQDYNNPILDYVAIALVFLVALMADKRIDKNDPRIWFSQLYGMSDNISFILARSGYNVAKYLPYGPIKAVMPYLLRRASENTSVAGQSSKELQLIRQEIRRRKRETPDGFDAH